LQFHCDLDVSYFVFFVPLWRKNLKRSPATFIGKPQMTKPTTTQPPPWPDTPAEQLARAAHIAGAECLADVKPTSTSWLWPGRIPLRRVTLLVSDPGIGKSLLTLDIAARVSRGTPWPDANVECGMGNGDSQSAAPSSEIPHSPFHNPPSSVLLLTAEDDLAETIRPRLEALGADCEKILAISSVPGENANDVPRAFALNRDLARLANLLDAMPDCRLLIVDPISAFLGGTNEHANSDIRTLLATLATLAREHHLAVLIVSHLRKKEGAAIYRTMGSLAFVAVARAAWLVCKDPEDADKRLLLPLKNNLAPNASGLAYIIESSDDGRAPKIRWLPDPVTVTPDNISEVARSVGRPDVERQHAIGWLQERLATGPRPTRDIKQEAEANGICQRTLRRAFRELSGEAVRQGPFPFGQWTWKLPGVDGQNPVGEFGTPTDFLDQFADLFQPWMPPSNPNVQTHAP
jgi:putative DNA primase/helicase